MSARLRAKVGRKHTAVSEYDTPRYTTCCQMLVLDRYGSSLLEIGELWHLHDRLRDDHGTLFLQQVTSETVSKQRECGLSCVDV